MPATALSRAYISAKHPPDNKDYLYSAAQIYGQENADNDYSISGASNPRIYYAAYIAFANAKCVNFTSRQRGICVFDATSTTITQSTYLQFPDSPKGLMRNTMP